MFVQKPALWASSGAFNANEEQKEDCFFVAQRFVVMEVGFLSIFQGCDDTTACQTEAILPEKSWPRSEIFYKKRQLCKFSL